MSAARLIVADRRTRSPFRRRKADTLRLVEQLHAMRWPCAHIALAMGLSIRRVQQVVLFLRLDAPAFATAGDALTWLAKQRPDLDYELRSYRYCVKRKDIQHEDAVAA